MNKQETKDMVDRCNKCGLCIPSCPVYQQVLTEAASPRGRVQLVKNYLEGKRLPFQAGEGDHPDLPSLRILRGKLSQRGSPGSTLYRFPGGIGQAVRAELEEASDLHLADQREVSPLLDGLRQAGPQLAPGNLCQRDADRKHPDGKAAAGKSQALPGPV